MQDSDFNPDYFERADHNNMGVHARFYWFPELDKKATLEKGERTYVQKEYIEIIAAGNSTSIIRRPADAGDRRRFSELYALFQKGDMEQLVGTSLMNVPFISRGQLEELMHMKVRTVEDLANLDDQACGRLVGTYELKRKAQAYLAANKVDPNVEALKKQNEELMARLQALEEKASKGKPKADA